MLVLSFVRYRVRLRCDGRCLTPFVSVEPIGFRNRNIYWFVLVIKCHMSSVSGAGIWGSSITWIGVPHICTASFTVDNILARSMMNQNRN
jgi:hypothetical protein